jgi:hypothetical protein
MDIPESALLSSLRTMNEATQSWSNDRSHLHGFADGWKTCLTTLLRVYGSDETKKQMAGLAEVCSVKATTVANPDLETQILVSSAKRGVA